jgi:hypothetical protein
VKRSPGRQLLSSLSCGSRSCVHLWRVLSIGQQGELSLECGWSRNLMSPLTTSMTALPLFWTKALRHLLPVLTWVALGYLANGLLSMGKHTVFGPGLIGAIFPILLGEAWLAGRSHWRTRLLNTLGFAIPAVTLAVSLSLLQGTCCFCDSRAGAEVLRGLETIGDFFLFNAIALCPAHALLAILWQERSRLSSLREANAYRSAVAVAFMATSLSTLTYGGLFYLLEQQLGVLH